MTADYAEEQSTSTQASDLLETETVTRMRLEKELRELQNRHDELQRKQEATELDLIQTRLFASSLEGKREVMK